MENCRGTLPSEKLIVKIFPKSAFFNKLVSPPKAARADLAHLRPDTYTGGWPAALAYAQQSLGAALVPTATLSPQSEPTFVSRLFDESFTLDEFLITRTDFSNPALDVTKSSLCL